jgi:hypothetical protein
VILLPSRPSLFSEADRREYSSATSGVLRWSAVVSLYLLSRVDVIVPDRFQAQEGLTSDDVQAGRSVIDNKVLRRRVAAQDREGPRWPESRSG